MPSRSSGLGNEGASTSGGHLSSPLQPKWEAAPADMLPMDMPGIWMGQKEINYWLPFHNEEGGQTRKVRQTNPI